MLYSAKSERGGKHEAKTRAAAQMDAEGSRSFIGSLAWRSRQIGRNQGGVGAAADSRLGGGTATQARQRRGSGFGIYVAKLLESQGKTATGWTWTLGAAAEESGLLTGGGGRWS